MYEQARPLLQRGLEDGNFEELIDPFLEGNYNNQELARMAACACASIRHSGKKRPKMSQVWSIQFSIFFSLFNFNYFVKKKTF